MSKVVDVNVIKYRCEYNSDDTKISLHDLLSVTLDAILWFICEDWAGNHFVFPYQVSIPRIFSFLTQSLSLSFPPSSDLYIFVSVSLLPLSLVDVSLSLITCRCLALVLSLIHDRCHSIALALSLSLSHSLSLSQSFYHLYSLSLSLSLTRSLSLIRYAIALTASFTYPPPSFSYSFCHTCIVSLTHDRPPLTRTLSHRIAHSRTPSFSLTHTHSLVLKPPALTLSLLLTRCPPSHALSLTVSLVDCLPSAAIGPNECWPLRSKLNVTGSEEH